MKRIIWTPKEKLTFINNYYYLLEKNPSISQKLILQCSQSFLPESRKRNITSINQIPWLIKPDFEVKSDSKENNASNVNNNSVSKEEIINILDDFKYDLLNKIDIFIAQTVNSIVINSINKLNLPETVADYVIHEIENKLETLNNKKIVDSTVLDTTILNINENTIDENDDNINKKPDIIQLMVNDICSPPLSTNLEDSMTPKPFLLNAIKNYLDKHRKKIKISVIGVKYRNQYFTPDDINYGLGDVLEIKFWGEYENTRPSHRNLLSTCRTSLMNFVLTSNIKHSTSEIITSNRDINYQNYSGGISGLKVEISKFISELLAKYK